MAKPQFLRITSGLMLLCSTNLMLTAQAGEVFVDDFTTEQTLSGVCGSTQYDLSASGREISARDSWDCERSMMGTSVTVGSGTLSMGGEGVSCDNTVAYGSLVGKFGKPYSPGTNQAAPLRY